MYTVMSWKVNSDDVRIGLSITYFAKDPKQKAGIPYSGCVPSAITAAGRSSHMAQERFRLPKPALNVRQTSSSHILV